MRRSFMPFVLAAAALLAACGSRPPLAPPPAPEPKVSPRLVAEQTWLRDLFAGTPVAIGPGPAGELNVEVPIEYCFDPNGKVVKPPLGAVLDRVALSLSRVTYSRLQIAAPASRHDALVAQLVRRGVAAHRLSPLPPRDDAVELRLVAPQAVERLDDAPPPGTHR